MYNRYVRNDQGQYARLPQEEQQTPLLSSIQSDPPPHEPKTKPTGLPPKKVNSAQQQRPTEMKILNGLLDKLHLGDIDAGDLLLLVLLFLMFRENGDEELLIALGLLLIL